MFDRPAFASAASSRRTPVDALAATSLIRPDSGGMPASPRPWYRQRPAAGGPGWRRPLSGSWRPAIARRRSGYSNYPWARDSEFSCDWNNSAWRFSGREMVGEQPHRKGGLNDVKQKTQSPALTEGRGPENPSSMILATDETPMKHGLSNEKPGDPSRVY